MCVIVGKLKATECFYLCDTGDMIWMNVEHRCNGNGNDTNLIINLVTGVTREILDNMPVEKAEVALIVNG